MTQHEREAEKARMFIDVLLEAGYTLDEIKEDLEAGMASEAMPALLEELEALKATGQ